VELIASPKLTRSTEDRVRIGQRLLASDRHIVKYIRHTAPCISTVVAIAALLYSDVLLRGMEPSDALAKACANELRNAIIAAYARRGDFSTKARLCWFGSCLLALSRPLQRVLEACGLDCVWRRPVKRIASVLLSLWKHRATLESLAHRALIIGCFRRTGYRLPPSIQE
jgi:hypothetical protein